MTTTEFTQVAEKLAQTGLITVLKKGEHGRGLLGSNCIGSTESQNKLLWRKYGTLSNILIFKPADEVNKILKVNGISEFTAKPTKSGQMCRLINNN